MKKSFFSVLAAFAAVTLAPQIFISEAETASPLDFSRTGYENKSVYAADFFEDCLNLKLFGHEREFFEKNSDFVFKYCDRIAGKYIFGEFDEGTSSVHITAETSSYTAANGSEVVWKPLSVNGIPFDGENCEVTVGQEDFVTIKYSTELNIPAQPVNAVLNGYYNEAKSVSSKLKALEADYNSKLDKYERDKEAYDRYVSDSGQYEQDRAAYEQYLADLAVWQGKYNDYQRYLKEKSDYDKEYEEYLDYQKRHEQYLKDLALWQNYQNEYAIYESDYEKFNEALKDPDVAKARKQLNILEYMDVPVGGRTLSGAIMGNSVTEVLSRLGEFGDSVLLGAQIERKTIERAESATRNLRSLITDFHKLTKEDDKYIFYISNYKALSQNFNELLRTLDYLYAKPAVKNEIEKRDKVRQFRILLAQLFEICNGLDNGAVANYEKTYYTKFPEKGKADFDGNYRIDGFTPSEILNGVILVDDNDAEPLEKGVPNIPVEPVRPEEVKKPEDIGPQPSEPVPPAAVQDPGDAPEKVKEPQPPDKVEEPKPPERYVPDEWEKKLSEEFDGGALTARDEYSGDIKITLSTDVTKYFRNSQTVIVSFYLNEYDEEPSYVTEAEIGSYAEYQGEIPTKTRTGYTCVFDYWVDRYGNKVDLGNLPVGAGDIKLYPHFNEIPDECTVIWVIDGTEYPQTVLYDQTPEYEGIPQKPDDPDGRKYRFSSWDKPLKPVKEKTVRYNAVFEASVLITFNVENVLTVMSVWKGDMPVYGGGIPQKPADKYYYYVFKYWSTTISPAEYDKEYKAEFERKYIVPFKEGGAIVEKSDGVYTADFTRAQQNSFNISKLVEFAAGENAQLCIEYGNSVKLNFSEEETQELLRAGVINISVYVKQIFLYQYEYKVELTSASKSSPFTFTMTAYGVFDVDKSRLYRTEDGESVVSRVKMSDDNINFVMMSGYMYEIYPMYSVNILESDGISGIFADSVLVKPNLTVKLTLGEVYAGRYFDCLYAHDSEGADIEISTANTFKMPSSDVFVGAACGFLEYNVTFVADGKTISTRTYRYGDRVEPPSAAYKPPDGEFSYEFKGWDREILPVTEDSTYFALFDAILLPETPAEPAQGVVKAVIWASNHIGLVCTLAALFLACVAAGIIIPVVCVRKKRRQRGKNDKIID